MNKEKKKKVNKKLDNALVKVRFLEKDLQDIKQTLEEETK